MNYTFYIFGDFGTGFTQYPDDFTRKILSKGIKDIIDSSEIVLCRDGDLIYYNYYRRLLGGMSPKEFIGFSVCFNGIYCSDIAAIFSMFERCIAYLAESGQWIKSSTYGDFRPNVDALVLNGDKINQVRAFISGEIAILSPESFNKLPSTNYGSGSGEELLCTAEQADEKIPQLIKSSNRIVIPRKIEIIRPRKVKESRGNGLSNESMTLPVKELKELKDLYESGILSEDEFIKQKNLLLERTESSIRSDMTAVSRENKPVPLQAAKTSQKVHETDGLVKVGLVAALIIIVALALLLILPNKTKSNSEQYNPPPSSSFEQGVDSAPQVIERQDDFYDTQDLDPGEFSYEQEGNSVPGRYPEGSTRYLNYSDVCDKSEWELSIMRNEIYARKHYIFKRSDLREYFERQPCYYGAYENANDVYKFFSDIEVYNVEFIKKYER